MCADLLHVIGIFGLSDLVLLCVFGLKEAGGVLSLEIAPGRNGGGEGGLGHSITITLQL